MAATSKEDGLARALAHQLWRLIVTTTSSCLRYRVTGLAAEAAFFAVLSMPPLVFALAGAIGYVSDSFSPAQVGELRNAVIEVSSRAMTPSAVNKIILPTFDDVVGGGRFDVISIGFILALWSGSRALNVFVDTITIMHGLGGHRGIVKTRALSFALYVMGLITGVITLPLVIAGPTLVRRVVPERATFLNDLYWPTVILLCICFLATLYHVSVPVRTLWRYNLPGATFSLFVVGARFLRAALGAHRDRGRQQVGLRPAGGTDRRTPVALSRLDRGADRRGRERRVRHAVPAELHAVGPDRADAPDQRRAAAAARRPAPGVGGGDPGHRARGRGGRGRRAPDRPPAGRRRDRRAAPGGAVAERRTIRARLIPWRT